MTEQTKEQLVKQLVRLADSINEDARKLGQLVGREEIEELRSAVAGVYYQIEALRGKLELGKLQGPVKKDIARIKSSLKR